MITEVIKRDGSVEKFDANKLSKWAEWAGDFGVDWFAIVGDAYKMCHNKCTTKDLHAALVNACLDKRTSPHFLMAGRLMVGELYKDVFGGVDNIPTLPSFYHKMIEEGYWEDMGYSEEELTLLNSVIDHTADFKLSSTQVRQDIQKYLISDVTTKRVKETPQFALMRQAMGAHKHQPSERRLQDVVSAYEDLKKGWINTPTPNKTNLGTHKRSYASCCASMAKDTLGSIEAQNHINYVMTAASAGQGNYLQVRSFGDKVRGGVIKHGGKLPYMRLQQEENRANMQGCYDGQTEILTEIGWVRFDNLQDGLKVAQVFDDGSSNFVVPKAKYVYDYEGEMVTFNSPRRGVDLLVTPNHRMVSWDIRKTQQALKEGEYQVDAHHVMGASHRVTEAADFTASRNNGIRKAVKVVGEGKTKLSAQERFEIAFQADGGQYCTDNYGYTFRFAKERKIAEFESLLSDVGYNYSKTVQKTGVTSFYVNVGKKLSKLFQYNLAEVTWEWAEQFLNEVVKWDGCLTIDSSKYGITYSTTEEKNAAFVQAVAVIAGWHSSISIRPASGNRKPLYKVLAMKDGGVTSSRAWKKSLVPFKGKVYCVEVETGMVVVRRNNMPIVCGNSRGGAVTQHINALDPEIFTLLALRNPTTVADKRIDKMDYSLQVNESFNERAKKNADWLLISVKDAPDLYEHFFEEDMSVFDSLMDKYIAAGKGEVVKARDVLIQHIIEDEVVGRQYEFNATNVNRHKAFKEPIVQSNLCQELAEPTKPYEHITDLYKRSDDVEGEVAMCNLAAIPVGVVSLKQENYEELAYRTLLMVDNTIDIAEIPLPHVDYTAKQRRSVMVGITDLAHAMADRGLFYSNIQGKNFIHRLAEMHAYSLIKASVRLAKEKGKCGWFHKTRYSEGWLPIDTYNKNVDKVHTQPLLCDWEGLRADILKYGMRNSALIGHMPCESSSIRNGDTNSLYPIREGVVTKVSGNTVNVFIAPEWERLQSFYELAWDVPYKDLIDMYAIVQKFTDQAISADIYHKFEKGKDKKVSLKMLLEQYFYRHDMGLKTRYYKNFATDIAVIEQEESCSGGSCKL